MEGHCEPMRLRRTNPWDRLLENPESPLPFDSLHAQKGSLPGDTSISHAIWGRPSRSPCYKINNIFKMQPWFLPILSASGALHQQRAFPHAISDRSLTVCPVNLYIRIVNLLNGFQICLLPFIGTATTFIQYATIAYLYYYKRLPTGLTHHMLFWPFLVYSPHSIHLHFKNANLIISLSHAKPLIGFPLLLE